MIIDFYILIELLIIGLLYLGWSKKHPMFWALAFIFSSINIFSSYNIQYVVFTAYSNSSISSNIVGYSFPVLSYINILFAMISMLIFFWDIFNARETVDRR